MCQAAGVLGLAIACAVSAAAWVYLVAAHGGFWRTGQRLPLGGRPGDRRPRPWPAVVAVVPARNEADSLPATLPALLAQDYPGEFRVFLVDDGSDDGTGGVAAELGGEGGAGRRRAVDRRLRPAAAGRLGRQGLGDVPGPGRCGDLGTGQAMGAA